MTKLSPAVQKLIKAAKPFHGPQSCNRIKYGRCEVLACLRRGGYFRGQPSGNYDQATCEAYALSQAAAALENPHKSEGQVALDVIDELWESLQEGLMTDADLTKQDRLLMKAQVECLEVVKRDIMARLGMEKPNDGT
jgi:hypothetical protein